MTHPLETIARPASESLLETRSERHFSLGTGFEELLAQFGQHPVADGNLISPSELIDHEINDLHCPEGEILANLGSNESYLSASRWFAQRLKSRALHSAKDFRPPKAI